MVNHSKIKNNVPRVAHGAALCVALFVSLCAALSGCATSKPAETSGENRIIAEAAREGIRVRFTNIPPETKRMFIDISSAAETPDGTEAAFDDADFFSRFADIRGEALERVKAAGEIVCPFVESGRAHYISVLCENDEYAESAPEAWAYAECTAGGGTYFDKSINLTLDEKAATLTLSGEPEFSSELSYAGEKYRYGITIQKDDYWSIGVGNDTENALSWEYEPQLTDELTESGYLESGSYPAYASAYCNALHEDLTWTIELARSEEFVFNF